MTQTASQKLRVLIYCRGVGVIDRGAERASLDLADALKDRLQVKIVSWGKSVGGIHIPRKKHFSPTSKLPKLVLRVLEQVRLDPVNIEAIDFTLRTFEVLRKFKPDVVISTGGPWEILFLRILRGRKDFKIVSVGHGGNVIEKQQVGAGPDAHVTLSLSSHDSLIAMRKDKVVLRRIPNMVKLEEFRNSSRSVDPSKTPVVLIVAAAVPYKNIELTMKAVSRAGFKMVWCGDGPLRESLLGLAKVLFPEGFFQWAKVPASEMGKVYSSADIFTLCSEKDQEAYGLVYLEAMASGLRCVATDDEIRREICGLNGKYVTPQDTEAYSLALKDVWGSVKKSGVISWDSKRFSPDAVSGEFLRLIQQILTPRVFPRP